jgi:hypothetical protein
VGVRTDTEARAFGASSDAGGVWVPSQVWILPVSDVVGLTGSSAQPPAALIPGSARRPTDNDGGVLLSCVRRATTPPVHLWPASAHDGAPPAAGSSSLPRRTT